MHHTYNGGFAYGVDRLTIGDLLFLLFARKYRFARRCVTTAQPGSWLSRLLLQRVYLLVTVITVTSIL
jgi:hypothetical protein